jgi:arsenite methyltransferase
MPEETLDRWAAWLAHRRHGDDPEELRRTMERLGPVRDRVLANAAVAPGETLLDVGAGDGLIAFGALDRVGPQGRVIFSDVSQDLLDECRRTAAGDERCAFVRAAAEELAGVADASVDVVTTRSVLIYCTRTADAFAEFFRVLRPGGRLSIFEPINGFRLRHRPYDLFGLAGSPVDDLLAKVTEVFTGSGPAGPMVDFDERDLLDWAVAAGFAAVELDYRAQLDVPAEPMPDWAALKHTAPNPLAPTYAEAVAVALDEEERERLDAYLTGLAASETPTRRTMAVAYLRATVPG